MFVAKNGIFFGGLPYSRIFQLQNLSGQVLWHACLTSAKNFNWLVVDFFKSIITSNPEMKSQVKIVMQIPWTYLFLWNITLANPMDLHFHAFILYLQESEEHQTIRGSWLICILHILPSIQLLFSWLSGVPSSKLTFNMAGKSIKFNIGHTPSLKPATNRYIYSSLKNRPSTPKSSEGRNIPTIQGIRSPGRVHLAILEQWSVDPISWHCHHWPVVRSVGVWRDP